MREHIENACEQIDAAVFSGDSFARSRDARDELRSYMDRWSKELSTLDEDESIKTAKFSKGQKVLVGNWNWEYSNYVWMAAKMKLTNWSAQKSVNIRREQEDCPTRAYTVCAIVTEGKLLYGINDDKTGEQFIFGEDALRLPTEK